MKSKTLVSQRGVVGIMLEVYVVSFNFYHVLGLLVATSLIAVGAAYLIGRGHVEDKHD